MDKKSLEKYRRLLLEKRKALLDAYSKNKLLGTEAGGEETPADMVDMATNAYTKEFLLTLSNTEREQLSKIDNALDRIEDCTYGTCQMCQKQINRKRLNAVPWARHCIQCQLKTEEESG